MSLLNCIFGKKSKKKTSIHLLDVATFKHAVSNTKVKLIDVRTAEEYSSGHIKNAQNIDFYSGKFNVEFEKLDKNDPVYIYCRSGGRSRQTADKLYAMGFKEIYDLKGGFLNYN